MSVTRVTKWMDYSKLEVLPVRPIYKNRGNIFIPFSLSICNLLYNLLCV